MSTSKTLGDVGKTHVVEAIHYIYEGEHIFEGVTDNFKLWLKAHNEERIKQGEIPEDEEDFEVTEVTIHTFNKGEGYE